VLGSRYFSVFVKIIPVNVTVIGGRLNGNQDFQFLLYLTPGLLWRYAPVWRTGTFFPNKKKLFAMYNIIINE